MRRCTAGHIWRIIARHRRVLYPTCGTAKLVADERRHTADIRVRGAVTHRSIPKCVAREFDVIILGAIGITRKLRFKGAVVDPDGPLVAVRKGSVDSSGGPRVRAIAVGDLDDLVRRVGSSRFRIGPDVALVPVHLTRSRPGLVQRITTNATVGEDQVLAAALAVALAAILG